MSERDSQTIVLSRQSILLVTAVSVGLLTLCYVLGVQVGKQSAALRSTAARGSGEELQELPASIEDQLKALQDSELVKAEKVVPKPKASEPEAPRPPELPRPPEAKPPEDAKAADAKWTLQLVATSDAAEAQRIAAKAKAAGFPTATVKDKISFKVRLAKPGARADMDALEAKLKAKGFKTFAVKVE